MVKKAFISILVFILFLSLGGCGKTTVSETKDKKIKVGIRSSELRTWEFIKKKAKKEGLDIELVNFNASVDPNQAS